MESRITVVGAGYVGLVAGSCLADWGHSVICVDGDPSRVHLLNSGALPFFEPGLAEIVERGRSAGTLAFSGDLAGAVGTSDIVIIAVGTPRAPDGSADLADVRAAARAIAQASGTAAKVVVIKSTVPVGAGDEIEALLRATNPRGMFSVVSNPEFLRQGSAVADFTKPERVVIGAEDVEAARTVATLYRPIHGDEPGRLVTTRRRSAELIKYGANAFLAMKLAFVNEMADLCAATGADIGDVATALGMDARIGPHFLRTGPGFGGSCLPKDTSALVGMGERAGVDLLLAGAVVDSNRRRIASLADRVAAALARPLAGAVVAVLGLSFKPGTDDVRESPALALVTSLLKAGATVRAMDPVATEGAAAVEPRAAYFDDPYLAAAGAHCVVLATEWPELLQIDPDRLLATMDGETLVDLRNAFDPADMAARGFAYHSLGRPPMLPAPDMRPRRASGGRVAQDVVLTS